MRIFLFLLVVSLSTVGEAQSIYRTGGATRVHTLKRYSQLRGPNHPAIWNQSSYRDRYYIRKHRGNANRRAFFQHRPAACVWTY